ncbi:MAG: GTP-binding protein [Acidobacteriota bacterium]|nr:GTP-binding protein [Acidobacteriota bacterium]
MAKRVLALMCMAVLAAASDFSGHVQSSTTGNPIAGAIVTMGSTVTRTDEKGNFQLRADGGAIGARAYGYTRSQAGVDARGAKSVQLKLTPVTPRAVYLSFWGVGTSAVREPVLNLALNTPVNAVVIDIKGDLGYICFRTGVALANEIGAQKIITVPDMPALLSRLRKQGIYTIGRIVTFKDNMLGTAMPKLAVRRDGKLFKDHEGLIWVDPFLPEVRKYNLDVAESAAKAGFDEIQFDYVRFPDAKGVEFSQPSTEESRPQQITAFLKEARERLVPYNVFLAADVFGYICWNKGDTGIGQDINKVAAVLDYISPMLYPSGFMYGIPNYRDPLAHSYEIVRYSLDRARERTNIDPVRFRPWLQAFADYAFDKRQFGSKEIQSQIKAAESFGADGWILWNPRNVYSAEAIRGSVLTARSSTGH